MQNLQTTCVTSKDSNQPVYQPTIYVYLFLDCPGVVKGTCDQQRLWSNCAVAQADLSLRWSHKSCCRVCCELAHFKFMLTLSTLGKIFCRRHFEIFFLFFPEKKDLTFHANCLLRRQFAWNVKSCFLGKIRKISSICHLLKMPREW